MGKCQKFGKNNNQDENYHETSNRFHGSSAQITNLKKLVNALTVYNFTMFFHLVNFGTFEKIFDLFLSF